MSRCRAACIRSALTGLIAAAALVSAASAQGATTLYWGLKDTGKVGTAAADNPAGANPTFIATGFQEMQGLAVDANWIYISNNTTGSYDSEIWRAHRLTGVMESTPIVHSAAPSFAITALAVSGAHLFFCDGADIRRVNTDGTDMRTGFIVDAAGIGGGDISADADWVYYATTDNHIHRASTSTGAIDGSYSVTTSGGWESQGMAPWDGWLYFLDGNSNNLKRASTLDGAVDSGYSWLKGPGAFFYRGMAVGGGYVYSADPFSQNYVTRAGAAGTGTIVPDFITDPSLPGMSMSYEVAAWTDPPAISAVAPATGPVAGGTTLVVTGSGFTDATKVQVGGVTASGYVVDSDTQITVTTPPHAAGTVDVVVTTPVGTATRAGAFTYAAPTPPAPQPTAPADAASGGATPTEQATLDVTGVTTGAVGPSVRVSVATAGAVSVVGAVGGVRGPVCDGRRVVPGSGTYSVRCVLTPVGRRMLSTRSLRVGLTVGFTPTGGTRSIARATVVMPRRPRHIVVTG